MSDINSVIFDIHSLAERLEEKLEGFLPEYPVGLYLPNQETPVIVPDQYYYVYRKVGGVLSYREAVGDVTALNEDIYNDDGLIVLPALKNPKDTFARYLRTEPTIPVHGLQIIVSLVQARIDSLVDYRDILGLPILTDEEIVIEKMNGEYRRSRRLSLEMREWLTELMRELRTDLISFVKKEPWAEYTISHNAGTLLIVRGLDWRVKDWYRKVGCHLPNSKAYIPK